MAWIKEGQILNDELYVAVDDSVWYGGQLASFDQNPNSAVITRIAKYGVDGKPMVLSVDNFRACFRLFTDHLSYVKGIPSALVECMVHIFKRLATNSGYSEVRLLLPFSDAEKVDLLGKLLLEYGLPQNSFRFQTAFSLGSGERDNVTKQRDTSLIINTERV